MPQARPEAGRGSDIRPGARVPIGLALPLLPPGGQLGPVVWPGGLTFGAGPCRLRGSPFPGLETEARGAHTQASWLRAGAGAQASG